jgi:hypothetical protein
MQGVQYLHESCQLAHGGLNVQSCLISQYWALKLSDYGLNDVLDELARQDMVQVQAPTIEGEYVEHTVCQEQHLCTSRPNW